MEKGWKSLQIPKTLFQQIAELVPWLGYRSVSEYVRTTLIQAVQTDKYRVEDLKKKDRME